MEPSLIVQTAVRAALLDHPAVSALVNADSIRAGSTRPDKMPCVILSDPQTINLGRTASGEFQTRVYLNVHIWAVEDGADMARQIGSAVTDALWDSPIPVSDLNEYERPSFKYIPDPDPEQAFCHGVGAVECVVRWSL